MDSARAAAYLGVSHQQVRRLLKAGADYDDALNQAAPDEPVTAPRRYLRGERVTDTGRQGGVAWRIPRAEVERLAAQRPGSTARPGYDVTLRPPKSVSVLWALSAPEVRAEIRQAHSDAVDEVVRYLEDRAVRARLSGPAGQRYLAETDGVIAAAFDHRTSRAGDPLLHTHVVVANMTRVDSPETGGAGVGPVWRAIAGYGLFEHAKAGGHLYQAHLRRQLSDRLGVAWGSVTNGYADVAGVPEEVVEVFSKRRSEITEVLAESGNTSAKAAQVAQVATLDTRRAKDYHVDPDTLFAHWRTEATTTGFTPEDAAACLHQQGRPAGLTPTQTAAIAAELAGPTGLTYQASTFARSDVIQAVADRAGDTCNALQIEVLADELITSDVCVVVDPNSAASPPVAPAGAPAAPTPDRAAPAAAAAAQGAEFGAAPQAARPPSAGSTEVTYTTVELAAIEAELLAWAADTTTLRTPALPAAAVEAEVAGRPELSVEQAAMITAVCAHRALIEPVAGRPGAGKTYATEAVVAAHVATGTPILGCAVSAAAAAELESQARFGRSVMPATTVAKMLLDLDGWGGLAPGSVVVVDEASMLATRDLHRLAGHARRAGGSIVLVGDPDQHGAVEVGGVFQRLCDDRADNLIGLVENNRQTQEVDREAISDYRQGHIADALARLDLAGQIIRSATAAESFDAMVNDWYTDHAAGRADPMIAGPNSTRRALNDRARRILKVGMVGAATVGGMK